MRSYRKDLNLTRCETEVRLWKNVYGINEIIPKEFVDYFKNKNDLSQYDIIKI